MNKVLRKRHRLAWNLLMFLLPTSILTGWLAIPNDQFAEKPIRAAVFRLPVIVTQIDSPCYTVRLRTDDHHLRTQLEWINKTVLTVPSALIYYSRDSNIDQLKWGLAGRIEARGEYLFNVDSSVAVYDVRHLMVYDFIHDQVIAKIKL